MRIKAFTFGVLVALVASASVSAAAPAVPLAVKRAASRIFGEARTSIEHEDGKYEVVAQTELEVVLDAKGAVAEIEVKLPLELVPANVLGAAKSALPAGARVEEAELLVRGSALLYEIEARVAAGEVELVLDAGGTLVSRRDEQDDDDDDDSKHD